MSAPGCTAEGKGNLLAVTDSIRKDQRDTKSPAHPVHTQKSLFALGVLLEIIGELVVCVCSRILFI